MDAKKFGALCSGTAKVLTELSLNAMDANTDGDIVIDADAAPALIEPLAEIIQAIAKGAQN